jgi:CP family cyanate transporter-like MFS transporter
MSAPANPSDRVASPHGAGRIITGRRGLLLVGILLTAANLRAAIGTVSPVLSDIQSELHLSAPVASALISVPILAFAVFSTVAPLISSRIGMERTIALALLVLAAGIVLRSLPWMPGLWIGTATLGLAIATLNVVLPSLIKRDFPHDVGRLTGLYTSVGGVAAAIAAGIAVPIAGISENGWRLACGLWAGLALIALAVFLPQLRSRKRPSAEEKADAVAEFEALPGGLRSPWGAAVAWQVTALTGIQAVIFYTVLTWWPAIDRLNGFSAATAGLHQVVLQSFTIVGSLATGVILHRNPRDQRLPASVFAAISFVAIFAQLFLPQLSIIWLAMIGFGCGSSLVLALSMFGFRTRHHSQAAALSGMAQSMGYILAAIGPVLAGVLHEATGGWTATLIVLLGFAAAQGVTGFLAGRERLI